MEKIYLNQNVYEAVQDRLKFIFEEFDNVLISFSGGKDSTVCLNLCYEYAKQTNQTEKLAFVYTDYEAEYRQTYEFVENMFNSYPEIKRKYWMCLPISALCSVNQEQTMWIPWDEENRDKWVRPMPDKEYVVNMTNCPYHFKKGTYGNDATIEFAEWYGNQYGKTASVVGIRADESHHRTHILCSDARTNMYHGLRWSHCQTENTVTFYPIYDWKISDVWHYLSSGNHEYNKLYDLMYQAGYKDREMRVASPFISANQKGLSDYKRFDPESWKRAVNRVSGVNYAAIYGGTSAIPSARTAEKPESMTWEEYAKHLIKTTPEELRKNIKLPTNHDIDWKRVCVAILKGNFHDMAQYVKKSDKKNPDELKSKWRDLMRGN